MDSYSKSPTLKVYLKLKQQECYIEKSIETLLANAKLDLEMVCTIRRNSESVEIERSLKISKKAFDYSYFYLNFATYLFKSERIDNTRKFTRKQLTGTLNENVRVIYEELLDAKSMINEDNVETIDLESFKSKLHSLWKRMQESKESLVALDALVAEQKDLESELVGLLRVVRKQQEEKASTKGSSSGETGPAKRSTVSDREASSSVQDLCGLLARSGHNGNWSEEDHQLFCRLRQRQQQRSKSGKQSLAQLVRLVQAKCPDLSREAIVEHELWYRRYLELREQQRQAVQQWRQRRRADLASHSSEQPTSVAAISAKSCDESCSSQPRDPCEPLRSPGRPVNDDSTARDRLLRLAVHKRAEAERKRQLVLRSREQREKLRLIDERRRALNSRGRRVEDRRVYDFSIGYQNKMERKLLDALQTNFSSNDSGTSDRTVEKSQEDVQTSMTRQNK
ncbi:coiled-coil domain-containing protein 112-like [Trichogramma pretiosum]|uniref:coiled-coil domain-containing protein 112-like n=1 Tax=Trichogramma pretiosum TaxID=7493 RepID=UPI0006C9AA07|nr:coiled-coil domain-containing protein 112-like [Trichogramma pretiosum]